MKYDVDFHKLIKTLLPFSLRSASIISLLKVLTKNIKIIYSELFVFKNEVENKLSYNSQYPSLQKMLNDKFDDVLRRITVSDDPLGLEGVFIRTKVYQECVLIQPASENNCVLISSHSKWGYQPFIISLPTVIYNDTDKYNQINQLIKIYKFQGTRFVIKTQ